ncbi:MAG: DUF5615 family PIN-like protein [Verrucomicrobia bacterium]|nr:DUF5615 family PIN-like protein [Verrucomicrobiota bacterium]
MRFLFDENLSVAVAIWAETTLTLDALGARAAGLSGKTGRAVPHYATNHDQILVTLNANFGNLARFSRGGPPRKALVLHQKRV